MNKIKFLFETKMYLISILPYVFTFRPYDGSETYVINKTSWKKERKKFQEQKSAGGIPRIPRRFPFKKKRGIPRVEISTFFLFHFISRLFVFHFPTFFKFLGGCANQWELGTLHCDQN